MATIEIKSVPTMIVPAMRWSSSAAEPSLKG